MKKNYLLSSIFGAMLVAMPVSADVIGMHTAAAVGDKLSFALNEGVKATLTWGDGSTEDVSFTGEEAVVTVRHADLTIETDKAVTNLYCPDCALTSLDLSAVPNLYSLTCPNNQLESLDLSNTTLLVELNCDGNLLTELSVSKCPKLELLNVANNKLTSVSLSTPKELKTLICSNNELKYLPLYNQKEIETVWCQGNVLKSITFSSNARPVQICAFDNEIESLKAENLQDVKELWLDNNKLEELDLSTAGVQVLSASNNLLKLIRLTHENAAQQALEAFYVDGNELMFNSLPLVYNISSKDTVVSYNIDNQRPYKYIESVNIDEKVDFTDLVRKNAWDDYSRAKLTWKDGEGNELVKGKDFRTSGLKCTFLKPFKSVIGEATSDYYPGAVFSFSSFSVVDPTGIEENQQQDGLQVSTFANGIRVTCSVPSQIRIYNVGGALVVNENLSSGTYSWSLPEGLYIVNGKKVVLSY